MNTTDLSLFISKNSIWIALIVIFGFLIYYFIKLFSDNEKQIKKVIRKFQKLKGGKKDNGLENIKKE